MEEIVVMSSSAERAHTVPYSIVDTPERNDSDSDSRRVRRSWILTGVGFLVMLSGVLYMTSSTVGGRVQRFSERRTYNETKQNMYEALPLAATLGLGGLGLMLLAARARKT